MKTQSFGEMSDAAKEFVATSFDGDLVESRPELVVAVIQAMATHALAVNIGKLRAQEVACLNDKPVAYRTAKSR